MSNIQCKICGDDYTHIVGTMEITVDDNYGAVLVFVNRTSFGVNVKYPYRSQGNSHVILWCESEGHFFIKSMDGHKGMVYVDDNELMDELSGFLSNCYERQGEIEFDLIYNIKRFFKDKGE